MNKMKACKDNNMDSDERIHGNPSFKVILEHRSEEVRGGERLRVSSLLLRYRLRITKGLSRRLH